jgi:hypothetical protein
MKNTLNEKINTLQIMASKLATLSRIEVLKAYKLLLNFMLH